MNFLDSIVMADTPEQRFRQYIEKIISGNRNRNIPRPVVSLGPTPMRAYAYPDGSESLERTRFTPEGHIDSGVPVDRTPITGTIDEIGISRLARALPRSQRGIIAYHSSPHKFDKFDFAKHMGSGEGAQTYGYGGYFAQSPKVGGKSGQYRRMGGYKESKDEIFKNLPYDAELEEVVELLGTGIFTRTQEDFIKALIKDDLLGFDYPSQAISAAFKDLGRLSAGKQGYHDLSEELISKIRDLGNTYKARIHVNPNDLLSLDSPIGAQPNLMNKLGRAGFDIRDASVKPQFYGIGNPEVVNRFREAGIPGLKFLDQISREVGHGTRNIVMFPGTEDLIKILRRY